MKMEWREVCDLSECFEIQKPVDILIDVLDNAVHAIDVHLETLARAVRHCEFVRDGPTQFLPAGR